MLLAKTDIAIDVKEHYFGFINQNEAEFCTKKRYDSNKCNFASEIINDNHHRKKSSLNNIK